MAKSQMMYHPEVINTFRVLCRSERKRLGITQSQMAKDLGVSMSAVSMLENGHRPFSYDLARQFNSYLKLNYVLPKPTSENSRARQNSTSIRNDPFVIELDGEIVEVVTYRMLGPAKKAEMADG